MVANVFSLPGMCFCTLWYTLKISRRSFFKAVVLFVLTLFIWVFKDWTHKDIACSESCFLSTSLIYTLKQTQVESYFFLIEKSTCQHPVSCGAVNTNLRAFCDRLCFVELEVAVKHSDPCGLIRNQAGQFHLKVYAICPKSTRNSLFVELCTTVQTLKKLLVFLSENKPLTITLFLHVYSPRSNCLHFVKSLLDL